MLLRKGGIFVTFIKLFLFISLFCNERVFF